MEKIGFFFQSLLLRRVLDRSRGNQCLKRYFTTSKEPLGVNTNSSLKSNSEKHFRRNAIYRSPPVSATMRKWLPPEPVLHPKSLHIAILGAPNAGKSTLLNCLLETTVSAVSPKYNTTNDKILGVYTHKNTQLVFVDTPGFLSPPNTSKSATFHYDYVESLVSKSVESIQEVDVVLLVVDIARRFEESTVEMMRIVAKQCQLHDVKLILVANKIDLLRGKNLTVAKRLLLPANAFASEQKEIQQLQGQRNVHKSSKNINEEANILDFKLHLLQDSFQSTLNQLGMIDKSKEGVNDVDGKKNASNETSSVFAISAAGREGIEHLKDALLNKLAKPRPWMYNSKLRTDLSDIELVEQVIRGKIFENLHAEVPYAVTQETRSWNVLTYPPDRAGQLVIDQDIQVPTSRIASMLLTRRAGAIKKITNEAISELSRIFGVQVHLFLHIVVKKP
jgi:GTPase